MLRKLSVWIIAAVGIAGATGCSDHRITFDQFLEMQEANRLAALEALASNDYPINPDDYLGPFVVGADDVLTITISGAQLEAPMPPFQARVDSDGNIELPGVGTVNVLNKQLEEAEEIIFAKYVPGYFTGVSVHVEILESDTTDVLVVGAVVEPGLIPLRRHQQNMLFAIVGAGGATDAASGMATLRRIRKPAEDVVLDLRHPVQLREALALDPLAQGDIIMVHAAPPNTIYVGGLVGVVGPQSFPPGVNPSMLQVLAGAGGLRPDVFPREATLIRPQADGTDIHVLIELDGLIRGETENLRLAAGDIFWVPHTWDTRVEEWVNRNIFFRAGMTMSYNVTGREYMNRPRQQNRDFGDASGVENIVDPLGFLVPAAP